MVSAGPGSFVLIQSPGAMKQTMDDGRMGIMDLDFPLIPIQGNLHLQNRLNTTNMVLSAFVYNNAQIRLRHV